MSRGSFWRSKVLNRNFSWLTAFGAWAKFFRTFDSNSLAGLSKLHYTGHGFFFMKNRYFKSIDYQFFSVSNIPGLRENFSGRISKLHSLCPVEQSMRKRFLKNIVFLHLRKLGERLPQVFFTTCLSELLSTCQGKISWKKLPLEKIINSFLQTRLKFSGSLAKVFWQHRPNWTIQVQRCFVNKIVSEKSETFAISENGWNLFRFWAIKIQQVCQNFYPCVLRNFFIKKIVSGKKSWLSLWPLLGLFSSFGKTFIAGLSKLALIVSTGTFRARKVFFGIFSHFLFHLGNFVQRFQQVCTNCILGSEGNVLRKNKDLENLILFYFIQTLGKTIFHS